MLFTTLFSYNSRCIGTPMRLKLSEKIATK